MRLSRILLSQHSGRRFRYTREAKFKYRDHPARLHESLKDMKYIETSKIRNLSEYFATRNAVVKSWKPPVDCPRFFYLYPEFRQPKKQEEDPNWNSLPAYVYDGSYKVQIGFEQALVLTKTLHMSGVPKIFQQDNEDISDLPEQDDLLQRAIMKAHKWDPTVDKLPKRTGGYRDFTEFPVPREYVERAEFGTLRKDILRIFISNLLRLCYHYNQQFPELLDSRLQTNYHQISSYFHLLDGSPFVINALINWLISSKIPLKPFADVEEIDSTATQNLTDLYPIAPTVDFRKENIYQLIHDNGFNLNSLESDKSDDWHPHTLLIANDDDFSPNQHDTKALLFTFATALSHARILYGETVEKLPQPISLQCCHFDVDGHLNWLYFQLNTLNVSKTTHGIKNVVWTDSYANFLDDNRGQEKQQKDDPNRIFKKLIPVYERLRYTQYLGYNGRQVFRKFLAAYLNGCELQRAGKK